MSEFFCTFQSLFLWNSPSDNEIIRPQLHIADLKIIRDRATLEKLGRENAKLRDALVEERARGDYCNHWWNIDANEDPEYDNWAEAEEEDDYFPALGRKYHREIAREQLQKEGLL